MVKRNSFKEIYLIYKYLDNKFPGITMKHIIQIYDKLKSRILLPPLSRNQKRKKELLIRFLNMQSDKIKGSITQIIPVDSSNNPIQKYKGTLEISWIFLDELENNHNEAGITNNQDQMEFPINQNQMEFPSNQDQTESTTTMNEIEIESSHDQIVESNFEDDSELCMSWDALQNDWDNDDDSDDPTNLVNSFFSNT